MTAESSITTPLTDALREAINERNVLRGFNMPEDHRDALDLAAALEQKLAAALARADAVEKDAERMHWIFKHLERTIIQCADAAEFT